MDFLSRNKLKIEEDYQKRRQIWPELYSNIDNSLQKITDHDLQTALKYLYAYMPDSDAANGEFECYEDFAKVAVSLWQSEQSVRALPEEIFLEYVLSHRVNDEEIRPCRSVFRCDLTRYLKEIEPAFQLDTIDTVLEVNFWCAREITYKSTDDRTLSSIAVYRRGNGRCGEESSFLVQALRSIGIPARQVYAPRWSHCDDNHAWVEVYIKGQWYFMGAAEPQPIINLGWFNSAASRAMLIHSRCFGPFAVETANLISTSSTALSLDDIRLNSPVMRPEIGSKLTLLNQLPRYALTKLITIRIKKSDGQAASGARVNIAVLNYSRYINIAALISDAAGEVKLVTGYGSLYLSAQSEDELVETMIDAEKQSSFELTLIPNFFRQKVADQNDLTTYVKFKAPHDAPVQEKRPTVEMAAATKKRLHELAVVRQQKEVNYINPALTEFKQKRANNVALSVSSNAASNAIDNATSNAAGNREGSPAAPDSLDDILKNALTAKDLTDITLPVLIDHFGGDLSNCSGYAEEIFVKYILSPRIYNEILSAFRVKLKKAVGEEVLAKWRRQPRTVTTWIAENIVVPVEDNADKLPILPAAAVKYGRVNNRLSYKLLTVALLRTAGVPARLNPVDFTVEYYLNSVFEPLESTLTKLPLIIRKTGESDWTYGQNFSLTKVDTTDITEANIDLCGCQFKQNELYTVLPQGIYRLLMTTRLPNGDQYVAQKLIALCDGDSKREGKKNDKGNGDSRSASQRQGEQITVVSLLEHHLTTEELQVKLSLPPIFLGLNSEINLTSLIHAGKRIFIWLEETREPTEHLLNEMAENKTAMAAYEGKVVFCLRSKNAATDRNISRICRIFPQIKLEVDPDFSQIEKVGRRMYVNHENLPLLLLTDGDNNGIYCTSGYNVGSIDMLLKVIRQASL